jgi:hypothetical protein
MGRFSVYLISRDSRQNLDNSKLDQKLGRGAPNISAARAALRCLIISGSLIGMSSPAHAQTPAEDIAAQIRIQGHQCDQPVIAKRNVSLSKPDSHVWTLECRNAAYSVRLVPDMSAHVVKLKKQSH